MSISTSSPSSSLQALPGKVVNVPLIGKYLASSECEVVDMIRKHKIVGLEAVATRLDPARKEKPTIHAVGDGTFIIDERRLHRREMMAYKLPRAI